MDRHFFDTLIDKYLEGSRANPEEKKLVEAFWEQLSAEDAEKLAPEERTALEELILKNVSTGIRPKVVPFYRRKFIRKTAAAAAILVMLVAGSYYLFINKTINKQEQTTANVPNIHDIKAPEISKATLQLDDGNIIYLDSIHNGSLALQGAVNITKQGEQIVYTGADDEIKYNTLSNPKGSRPYLLKLADGTMVWLNAASSLRYPVAFAGNERNVSISGEAYFEVAPDKAKPFRVSKGDMQVEVLGTHFNVKANDDETDIKVTLLEGSVKVATNGGALETVTLKPGQQAVGASNSPFTIHHSPDLEQVMAWKNGLFKFNGEDLRAVMKQIERWYDVEVVYEGKPQPLNFGGVISRKENASSVLELMEITKQVQFRIEPSATATAKIVVIQ